MDIEIIECYFLERDESKDIISANLRVKLVGLGLSILGVYFFKSKKNFFIKLPNGKGFNPKTNSICWFPFLDFDNKDYQRELVDEIKRKGLEFIQARFASGEPIVLHKDDTFHKKPAQIPRMKEGAKKAKETITIEKPKQLSSIANKVWVDPPPRKIATAQKMRK